MTNQMSREKLLENIEANLYTTHASFYDDAIEAVGLKGHPKADKAFSLAWSYGHSSGVHEVFSYLSDIAELLK